MLILRNYFFLTENINVCCDEKQIDVLDSELQRAEGIFGRCTTCVRNLFKYFCEFTCAKDQSRFMKVTEFIPDSNSVTETDVINFFLFYITIPAS